MNVTKLEKYIAHFPLRFHMTMILAVVTSFALLVNYICHLYGVDSIGRRYLIVMVLGYGFFLLLVRFWVSAFLLPKHKARRSAQLHNSHNYIDVIPTDIDLTGSAPRFEGGGGGFSGGGASGSWDDVGSAKVETAAFAAADYNVSEAKSSDSSPDVDSDSAGIIAIILIVGAVVSTFAYVIYSAPTILLDTALQIAFSKGLITKYNKADFQQQDWFRFLLRETWIPYSIMTFVVVIVGYWANLKCPQAIYILDLTREICRLS